jgi:hypothetical protein
VHDPGLPAAKAISGGQAGVVHMNTDACNAANRS